MSTKTVKRQELCGARIDDPASAGLIDAYYTDFDISEEDQQCLDRFLRSPVLEVRREALIALMFSTGRAGPKFTGYAIEALVLHLLGVVADSEAQFTGVSALHELASRGDGEAAKILDSLNADEKWRRKFRDSSQ